MKVSSSIGLAGLVCLLAGFSGPAAAQTAPTNAPRARAYRITEPPVLDGLVNEDFWQTLKPAADFVQQNPEEGQPASEPTEVRIAYDENFIYFGIICFDSQPENIVITQNRRDASLENTDSVEILLDTFDDDQNAFIFGTSPTGIEFDGQVSKAGQGRGGVGAPARAGGGSGAQRGGASAFNLNWDGVWDVRSQITERGWESEIAIPFRTLRYRPREEYSWGLNISRNLRRRNEQTFWSPVSRAFLFTQVSLAGSLDNLETEPHRSLKLLPYVIGGVSQDYTKAVDRTTYEKDGGLDVKYSVTPGLTLDASFNTDFSQVEVDDQQINLTRFDLFFPEKRPFFLENAGIFEVGTPREVELFFSRRIGLDENRNPVPIDAGVRLSGKSGKYEVGMLNMQTRAVDDAAPANNYTVARISRQLANRSSFGLIATNRQATTDFGEGHTHSSTFGADLNLGIGQYGNWFSYVAKSNTPGRENSDHAFGSAFAFDDTNHQVDLSYVEVGRNFNPEVGFVRRVGYRKPTFGYRYTHYPKGSRMRSIFPHFQWNRWYTIESNSAESGFEHYHVDTRWQNGGQFGMAFNRNYERLDKPFQVFPGVVIPKGSYPFNEFIGNYSTDPTATFFVSGNVAVGDFYDGTIRTVSVNGGVRKGQNLTWITSYARNFIRLPYGDFDTDLVGLRFNWSFTPKSYLQTFSQYNSRTNQIGHNIRLGLLKTSSTGLFVVYNTATATRDFTDPHEVERRILSRAFFIKFNHLLDF